MSAKCVLTLCVLCLSQLSDSSKEIEEVEWEVTDAQEDINKNIEDGDTIKERKKTEQLKMEGKIVGGALTSLDKNPHAAYLSIDCNMTKVTKRFGCGSSILNQEILITAAHCLDKCNRRTYIAIATASENKYQGLNNAARNFLLHPKFVARTLTNDIALVRIKKKLNLGPKIKRVILVKNPPKISMGTLAGWGLVNEKQNIGSSYLKMTIQEMVSDKECKRTLKKIPDGTICAKATYKKGKLYGYAAKGDSGSGLIGDDFILRGVVSFKIPKLAETVVVYTSPSYFYDWIQASSRQLMCV